MEQQRINPETIPGWGVDADPENEPTYPMKHYTGDDHNRLNYERPPLQEAGEKDFHSNERPGYTAVYGTSVRASGLSGAMRKFAFKYSENHYGHWLTLILADRVNVVEGIISDIGRGRLPNIFAEKGLTAEWKYNKKKFIPTLAVYAAFAGGFIWAVTRKKKSTKLFG